MKKIFLVMLCSLFLFGCAKDEDTLIMVTEAGFAPYEYYENGEIVGVDIDIANEISSRLGKKLKIKDIDFDSIINELNSGKADFTLAGLSITEERSEQVDFTIEYAESKQVVIAKTNSSIKTIDDLKNKKISVQLGSVADEYASAIEGAKVVQQKKYLTASEDVKSGKSDCLIMDALPAAELVKNNTELKILDIELFTDRYAAAVAKGNQELLEEINSILNDLINEGKIEEYIINHTK